jgi:hypothetical protein
VLLSFGYLVLLVIDEFFEKVFGEFFSEYYDDLF